MGRIRKGVYFITGAYGVGKTHLCDTLSNELSIPYFSASELISAQNNEIYGANKAVKDKLENQQILQKAIAKKLIDYPAFFLNGHTAIFKKDYTVDLLPISVFQKFNLVAIILLETLPSVLLQHLNERDNIMYSELEILNLINAERNQSQNIARQLQIPLLRHLMKYDETDAQIIRERLAEAIYD